MAAPVDTNRLATNGSTAGNPITCNLPSGIVSGDLILLVLRTNNASITTPGGWNALRNAFPAESGTDDALLVAYRISDGTEGGSVSVTLGANAKFASIAWRITGITSGTAPEIAVTVASSQGTSVDPPSLSPTGGSKEYLWMWLGGWTGEQTSPPASGPTNYSNWTGANSGTGGSTASNCRVAGGSRQLTGSSENPPAVTISVADWWTGMTVAIYPLAGTEYTDSATVYLTLTPSGTDTYTALPAGPVPLKRKPAHRFLTVR